MRDYDNMPEIQWSEEKSALKAKAQILHQEPVILLMPSAFDCTVDIERFDCELHGDPDILVNCDGGAVLHWLAEHNGEPGLKEVAEACIESGSQVDIDTAGKRLIVHD